MNVSDIISFVRLIINETTSGTDTFTEETDAALKEFIMAAMKQIALMPGVQIQKSTLPEDAEVVFSQRPDGLYFAIISAPDDFLAPLSIRLGEWKKTLYNFLSVTNDLYHAQYSSVKGVGNGPSMPVAFISTEQNTVIIAHASSKADDECDFRYIAIPTVDDSGEIQNFPADRYRECLAYTAAGLYLQSVNEYDAAKTAFDTAGACLQPINKEQ